jgi:hypothetical protein
MRNIWAKLQGKLNVAIYQFNKLCNITGCTYDISIYLGMDRPNAVRMRVTHATVKSLTRRVEGIGQKLYTDNLFSSLDLFDTCT